MKHWLYIFTMLTSLSALGEYGLPLRPDDSGQAFSGHVVYRAVAAQTNSSSNYLAVGRAWTGSQYKGVLKSSLVNYGFPNGNFSSSNGWNPGEQFYDFAGDGLDNLCNAVVYAYDGFIAACRSMSNSGYYNIYLIKVDTSGNLVTAFGTNGIADTGLNHVVLMATNQALVRGIAYNPEVNVAHHGVVAVVGAVGNYSPGHFNSFIATFDQQTGEALSGAVTDENFYGTAVGVTYDTATDAYYVASTETSATNHFYVEKYTHSSMFEIMLDTDTTHSWDTAVDFTAAISGGAAHSVPSSIAVFGSDVVIGGANRVGSSTPPWRCAVVALKKSDGTLDTSFGSVPLTGGTNGTGISLFSHESSPANDCIINQVLPTATQIVATGTAYTTGNANYDYMASLLNSGGALVGSFGNGDVAGTETFGVGAADDVLNATTLINSGSNFVAVGRSTNGSGYQGGDAQYFDVSTGGVAPTLQSLSMTPSLIGVAAGNTAAITVTATFSDSSSATISSSSFNWSSNNTSSFTVSDGTVTPATGNSAIGSAAITSSIAGITTNYTLTNPGFLQMGQARSPGSEGEVTGYSSAIDASGNSYVVGSTQGGLGANPMTANVAGFSYGGENDCFVAKYNSSGTMQWVKQFGSSDGTCQANGVSVDASGNSYTTGYTSGGLNGNPLVGSYDFFIVKYNASGTLQWLNQVGAASDNTVANGVWADASGNSFVVGYTSAGLNGNPDASFYDYFIAKYNTAGTLQWLKQLGASATATYAQGVSVDPSGNSYVAGYTYGGLYGNTRTGTQDLFVAKYDPSGTLQWVKQRGASSTYTWGQGVSVDASGNSFIAGYTEGGIDDTRRFPNGVRDFFIAKYNTSGTIQWLKQLGVSGQYSQGFGVSLDPSGNSYIGGVTTGGLNSNTQTGANDLFVAKYNSSGTLQWLKQIGVASQEAQGRGISVDASGNSYIAGYTSGGLNGNTQAGVSDSVLAKYNTSGTLQWLKQLGVTSQASYGLGVAMDPSGNSYVVGNSLGGLNGNTRTGTTDFFVAKYNSSGALQWTRQMGADSVFTTASSVAVDASGNSYVAGGTFGGLNGNSLTGTEDFFIAKYNTSGTLQWVTQLGPSSQYCLADGIALDPSGNIYISGVTFGALNGNSQTGSADFFVAKYNPAGTLQWLRQMGRASKMSEALAIAVDASGNSYLAGHTSGGLNGNSQTGSDDIFTAKYNTSGTLQWLYQLGVSTKNSQAYGVAADGSGNAYLVGETTGGLAGASQTGSTDAFIAKYGTFGRTWLRQVGVASGFAGAKAVSVDASGNGYFTGYSESDTGLNGASQTGEADMFLIKFDNVAGNFDWTTQFGIASQYTYGQGVTFNSSGNVFVTGNAPENIDGNLRYGKPQYILIKYDSSGLRQ
jgi:uncharacterized delta-60 repeat protein